MDIAEVERYTKKVLPNLRERLLRETDDETKVELYILYEQLLRMIAPYDFATFNEYLEFDEDKKEDNKGFHHHRKNICLRFDTMEYDEYDVVLISLPPRCGKALRNSELVLTPSGWVEMGNIEVGSTVYNKHGKETKVIGVFPQGERDVYRVTFDDGTTVDCDLEHLWTVQTRDDRNNGRERVVTTAQMLENLYVENGTRKNYSIEYVKPIEFSSKLEEDDLHPYLLGALIGDGGLSDRMLHFFNEDYDIIERVNALLPDTDKMYHLNTCKYIISKKDVSIRENGKTVKCTTSSKLEEYGLLGKLSHEKFIPHKYLYSSVNDRLELLRGLMDTDGYSGSKKSSQNEFTTVSKNYLSR